MIRDADLTDGMTDSRGGKPALFESNPRAFKPGIINEGIQYPESRMFLMTIMSCFIRPR